MNVLRSCCCAFKEFKDSFDSLLASSSLALSKSSIELSSFSDESISWLSKSETLESSPLS